MTDHQDAPVRVGDILAGKYRVEKVLGMGAMGVVVAALHVDLQERRAIKFMLPSMVGDGEALERFLREARAAVRLKSEHVAKIHDVGRIDAGGGGALAAGSPYIVMEYLEGSDLKALLEAHGTLSVGVAVTYLLQACEAIAEAHALGIVHRDLKPANLFLTRGVGGVACIKVLDFGIAKVPAGQGAGLDMTATSQLLGTPLYMSPEQMRSTRNADPRSDIWALGVILYRMLTGRTPFAGSSVTEICAAVIGDQPDAPAMLRPDVPPALDAVVMRCLEKNPSKRFATAAELAAALAPFAGWRAPAPMPQPSPILSPAQPATPPTVAMTAAPTSGTVGHSTARASAWTQPGTPAAPAPRPRSIAALVGAGVALVVLGGGAAVVGMRLLAPRPAQPATITPSITPVTEPPTAPTAPSAVPTAPPSAAPASSALPAPPPASALPAPGEHPRTGARNPRAAPLPELVPPPSLPPAPRRDAFGDDRK